MKSSLQQLQQQILNLPKNDRQQLVRIILASLEETTTVSTSQSNLSKLRGIAKNHYSSSTTDYRDDYTDYLTNKGSY